MAKRLSGIDRLRKGAHQYQKSVAREISKNKAKAKKAAQRARDTETLAQWRALRKIGAIQGKVKPNLKNITPARARKIRSTFNQVQEFATFANGLPRRPLEAVEKKTTRIVRKNGVIQSVKTKTRKIYELNDYFAFLRTDKKLHYSNTLKTSKGYLVKKTNPAARVRVKGKKITETLAHKVPGKGGYEIAAEGLSGPDEILALVESIEAGTFKLPKGQGLRLLSNGQWPGHGFLFDDLDSLAALVREYEKGRAHNFGNWADHADIVTFKVTRGG